MSTRSVMPGPTAWICALALLALPVVLLDTAPVLVDLLPVAAATCGAQRLVEIQTADPCHEDSEDTYYRAASFTCL